MSTDPFWAEQRAIGTASCGQHAAPTACGTCRNNVQAGERVEHEECAQRATLLQAPDHPSYELLAGFSLEENAQLPARFHVPVFDDCGTPNAWLCAVCWEDGAVSLWPCKTATEQGTKVFTSLHEAETAQNRLAARIAELESQVRTLAVAAMGALPMPTGDPAPSPWERAVAGLNALVDAGVAFHVEPDGHISAPFSDEHIEWDLKARRWVLTHDDEDDDSHEAKVAEYLATPHTADWPPAPGALTEEQARRIERDRPETNTAHDCNLPLTRRLDCGHCPHEVCQDCDRCPHTCRCASPEDPHDSPLHQSYATPHDLPELPVQRDRRAGL